MKLVYLSGGIWHVTDPRTWRNNAKKFLPEGWQAVDPCDFEIEGLSAEQLIALDLNKMAECHAVIARVFQPSWGTAMELERAHMMGLPVFAWSKFSGAGNSPWLRVHVTKFFLDLKECCEELKNV